MESRNVATYQAGHEAFNQRDFVAMTKLYADSITWTDHSQGRTFRTPPEFRDDFLAGWVQASHDIRITSPRYIDAGQTVVCTFTVAGTHDGPLGLLAATGKEFTLPLCEMWHFDSSGRVVGGDLYYDQVSLLMAGWGEDAPAEARNALTVLLSKLRHGLGAEHLRGRTEIELLLPPATFVDAEAALEGAHRAESAIAEERWAQAWGPAGIAYHIATRPFLTGLEAPWIDEWRRRLDEIRLRGLECFAAASLGLGGPALAQAEERARMLTELAPYRETGHRLLMEALARRGNVAEALRAYERLRVLLREELGITPSPTVQGVHRRLLENAGS